MWNYYLPRLDWIEIDENEFIFQLGVSSTLSEFIKDMPNALLKQYEFEEPEVRRGDQMTYSPFLRVSVIRRKGVQSKHDSQTTFPACPG